MPSLTIPVLLSTALLLAGCGGGGSSAPASPSPPAAPTVTSTGVTGTATFTARGQAVQLTATATMSNGTSQVVTGQATWQSSNAAVATVTAAGSVTSVGNGEATITATYQGVSGTLRVTVTLPTRAVPEITATLSVTLSADSRGKYMSTASFTFRETGGVFGYTVTAFQIIYRDQAGAAIGNPQTWDAVNIGLALGNSGRIEAAGTKSNWPVVLFWNPPLTGLKTDWQATVRDDVGVTSTLQGSQSANMPPG